MPELLPDATAMDAVTLHVEDLPGMARYYREALGLATLTEADHTVALGRGDVPVVVLHHTPGLPQPRRDQAGLFHTAVLFPTQGDLAAAVATAARHPRSRFVGSADHLVSEAFYFTDPEGNGIELYADRDRDRWPVLQGQIPMPSLALDARAFLDEHLSEDAVAGLRTAPATVGHVHLQVGDLTTAESFYADTLGFAVTFRYPGALFVSAGGYHHHLAMNVWNSRGAGPRASTLGLGEVAIAVPTRAELDAVAARLRGRGAEVSDDGATVRTLDPWHNRVALTVTGA